MTSSIADSFQSLYHLEFSLFKKGTIALGLSDINSSLLVTQEFALKTRTVVSVFSLIQSGVKTVGGARRVVVNSTVAH